MRERWQLGGNKKLIWLEKGEHRIDFDIVIPIRKGALYCMYHKRTTNPEMAAVSVKMSVDKAHEILGHPDESRLRNAAKALGWKSLTKIFLITTFNRLVKSNLHVSSKQ